MVDNEGETAMSDEEDMAEGDFPVRFAKWGVAERLRTLVKRKGGNEVVAKRSGIPLGTLNNYLRGRYNLKLPAFVAIAAACEVSLDWLATGFGPEHSVWSDPIMFERDIPPEMIAHGPVMPFRRQESAAEIPMPTEQGQFPGKSGVREHQESVKPPPAIDAVRLQQAIGIVRLLDGIAVFEADNVGERVAAAYDVLTGAKS